MQNIDVFTPVCAIYNQRDMNTGKPDLFNCVFVTCTKCCCTYRSIATFICNVQKQVFFMIPDDFYYIRPGPVADDIFQFIPLAGSIMAFYHGDHTKINTIGNCLIKLCCCSCCIPYNSHNVGACFFYFRILWQSAFLKPYIGISDTA